VGVSLHYEYRLCFGYRRHLRANCFFSVISYWIILLAAKLESKNTDERSDEKLSRCRFREAYSAICAALSKYMTHTTLGGYKAKTRIF